MNDNYKDMLTLPHPVSATHPRMPLQDRAAQFSPFAALTGYEDALKETARRTEDFAELDEDVKQEIDRTLQYLREQESPQEVQVTYFEADEKKSGGHYRTITGAVRRVDDYARSLQLENGIWIPIDAIYQLELLSFSKNLTINDIPSILLEEYSE